MHKGNGKVQIVLAAVSAAAGLQPFYVTRDQTSSMDPLHVAQWQQTAGAEFTLVLAPSVTIAQLMNAAGGSYQFITVDAEGKTLEILCAIPLPALGTELVCAEYHGCEREMTDLMSARGFHVIHRTTENLIFSL